MQSLTFLEALTLAENFFSQVVAPPDGPLLRRVFWVLPVHNAQNWWFSTNFLEKRPPSLENLPTLGALVPRTVDSFQS